MLKKMMRKKLLSGILSVVFLISGVIAPFPAYALGESETVLTGREVTDNGQEKNSGSTVPEGSDAVTKPDSECSADVSGKAGSETDDTGIEAPQTEESELSTEPKVVPDGTESPAEPGFPTETELPAGTEPSTGTELPAGTEPSKETELPAGTEPSKETELPTGTEPSKETELPAETEDPALVLAANAEDGVNQNKSFVSGMAVKEIQDGVAPFDDDDGAGNDSSASNGIVRSFDYVDYTLEYTTALMDTAETVDEAYMMAEFILTCDPSIAEFNMDTLNWCIDRKITYYYEDGSSSDVWDSSRPVSRQVLTGKRYLSKTEDRNAIPGVGTLSTGIYVKGAKNGDVVKPVFHVWMEGNEEALRQSAVGDEIRVSAAPRYNVRLVRSENCEYLGYFDPEDGTVSETDNGDALYGRLEGYAVILQLCNSSQDKGLKGIELPAGAFTFDLTVTEKLNGRDVTEEKDYAPVLWDYRENIYANAETTGYLGRQMCVGGKISSAYGAWIEPWNKGGARNVEFACYDGGTIQIAQDSARANVYHVTMKDYAFDIEDFDFPSNTADNSFGVICYGPNIGCFAAGYVQFLCQSARSVDKISNLIFTVAADNMRAASISGQTVQEEQNDADNSHSLNVPMYPIGSYSKRNFFMDENGGQIASYWSYGDAYAAQGQQIRIVSTLDFYGDGSLSSANILQKFDDRVLEIPAGTSSYAECEVTNDKTVLGPIRVLFAAKPDRSGWTDDAEMNATREEELIYFESVDTLTKAGCTCVGFLYEIRDSKIYQGKFISTAVRLQMDVRVKENAEVGCVCQTTNDLRIWRNAPDALSWSDVSYGGGACGSGSSGWQPGTYYEGYAKPVCELYTDYGKSVYQKGSIVDGHSGGYIYGNSLLITGCRTGVSIAVGDTTVSAGGSVAKLVYDLDAGERIAAFVIHPSVSVVSENSEVDSSEAVADVTVTAALPVHLTYIMDSASMAPASVTENQDGTSTITWFAENRKIGEALENITFSCIIGEAGTADDVQNNDTLTVGATITADKDDRVITKAYGNCSDTTITVIRLATSSVSKAVEHSLLEGGETITYFLRYGNSAEEDVTEVRFYDILPYNQDGRGTSFSGAYLVDSITMDFSSARETYAEVMDGGGLCVQAAMSESARDAGKVEAILSKKEEASWLLLGDGAADGTSITWNRLSLQEAVGLFFELPVMKPKEYLSIRVTLAVRDDSGTLLPDVSGAVQKPGDCYANSFYQYADGQVTLVESNTVKAQVVERIISGLAWLDEDGDGIRNDGEPLLSGITAGVYRTTASGYAPDAKPALTAGGVELYEAYDVFGNASATVKTGKDGMYSFGNLSSGTYYVVLTGTEGYGLTEKHVQENNAADSDADATLSADHTSLQNAYISHIALPRLEDMYTYHCESSHNDAGFLSFTAEVAVRKEEAETNVVLPGAEFVLKNADGNYVTFLEGCYSGVCDEVDASCRLTTSENGMITAKKLPEGIYTMSEYQAPEGYAKSDAVWKIEVGILWDDGWRSQVTVDGKAPGEAFVVKNQAAKTKLTVTKRWDDQDDQDGLRGDATFRLTGTVKNAEGKQKVILERTGVLRADASVQSYVFADLPAYAYGRIVQYAVKEEAMEGYATTDTGLKGSWDFGYTVAVTNTHETAAVDIPVEKIWEDEENQDGLRTASAVVILSGSDGSVREAELSAENGWNYVFQELPVYWNKGVRIIYSLQEKEIDGYTEDVLAGEDGYSFTVTNHHIPAVRDMTVVKQWEDEDNRDGIRPEHVMIHLCGSDGRTYDAKLNEEGGYSCIFTELPVYWKEGERIVYSVTEDPVEQYEMEIQTSEDGGVFTVINHYEPETRQIKVTKVWKDAGDQDGLRRDVSLTLTGSDGVSYSGIIPKDAVEQVCIFSDLPVCADGEKLTYALSEKEMAGYTTEIVETADGFTVINTHTPETKPDAGGGMDTPGTPKTGDNSNIAFWLIAAGLSVLGIAASLAAGWRKETDCDE